METNNNVEFLDNSAANDDCVICRATRLAEANGRHPTLDELRAAFSRAEELAYTK